MNIFTTVLGSGAALPTGLRHCSAQVLNVGGFKLLIDCAEGTQDGIRRNHIRLQSLSTILISHLHGDHFFGLPGLLSTMHLCGRKEQVCIIAPKGAKEVIETTFSLTGNHVDFPIEWVEMHFDEGMHRVFENNKLSVDAFPLIHSVPTYGFRFSEKTHVDKPPIVYTYCCDTLFSPSLVPFLAGSTLLCLECTFANDLEPIATSRCHLTAGQAGRLARLASAERLLLTHISARYREPQILLAQASVEFENSILAADSMRVEIGGKGEVVYRSKD